MSGNESTIKTIVTQTQVLQTPEDAEIGSRVRQLINRALDEAESIIEFGSTEDRNAIIKSLLGPAGRLVGVGGVNKTEEARGAFMDLMTTIRSVPSHPETIVTDNEIIDAKAQALPRPVNDQDEVDGDEEV